MSSSKPQRKNIKIFFWYGGPDSVGHVSLFISENCLYISFWPEDSATLFDKVKCSTNEYEDDVSVMHREADHIHEASIHLDLTAVEKYWKKAKRENYSFLTNNCASAVLRVLNSGNSGVSLVQDEIVPEVVPIRRLTKAVVALIFPRGEDAPEIDLIIEKLTEFRREGLARAAVRPVKRLVKRH